MYFMQNTLYSMLVQQLKRFMNSKNHIVYKNCYNLHRFFNP